MSRSVCPGKQDHEPSPPSSPHTHKEWEQEGAVHRRGEPGFLTWLSPDKDTYFLTGQDPLSLSLFGVCISSRSFPLLPTRGQDPSPLAPSTLTTHITICPCSPLPTDWRTFSTWSEPCVVHLKLKMDQHLLRALFPPPIRLVRPALPGR